MITSEGKLNRAEEVKLINLRTHRAAEHLLKLVVNHDIPLRLICECGSLSCDSLVEVPFGTLESIRKKHGHSFVISPSHFDGTIFKKVTAKEHYWLVDKR